MKINIVILIIAIFTFQLTAQNLKPYTLAIEASSDFNTLQDEVKAALKANNFKVLGSYSPANDSNRKMIAFTSDELLKAVSSKGGLRGFASALRIGITKENGKNIVSYTTPEYWMSAYFQKDYTSVKSTATSLHSKLQSALATLGTSIDRPFGSEKGLTSSELQAYHYMFGMPYFDDNIELATHSNFESATSKIESNLKANSNIQLVYKIKVPGKNVKLYGIGLSGSSGESSFLPTIDTGNPKHTAFLPYEILVIEGNIYMMHGRYRIALAFPDLSMGTFMKIVSTPGDIKSAMETASK